MKELSGESVGVSGGVFRGDGDSERFCIDTATVGRLGAMAEAAGEIGAILESGLGAILTSSKILALGGGGYPLHSFLDRTH